MNTGVFDVFLDAVRNEKIIDSPSYVFFASLEHVGPPAVGIRCCRVQVTEGIGEAGIKKGLKASALVIGKAMLANVWLGVCQVNWLMGDVEVTTE